MKYQPQTFEKKWADQWASDKLYQTPKLINDSKKRYILDMFPYPSGAGLHVGHIEGYTATDIFSRYSRMKGYQVLHPMGFDSFGLPAENYAIKTGVHPAISTEDAIKTLLPKCNQLAYRMTGISSSLHIDPNTTDGHNGFSSFCTNAGWPIVKNKQ